MKTNSVARTLFILTCSLALFAPTVSFAQAPPGATGAATKNAPGVPPSAHPGSNDTPTGATGSIVSPKVFFVEPHDGETVAQDFTVKFGLSGMTLAPAGKITPGAGHHHLIIDAAATPKDQVVPTDATHLHFGKAQTETKLKLAPGKHTLTLQFADGAHRSYGPAMSSTITVNVK